MRVPFVLLTGFLGSGKTTLVNRILARRAARGATGKLGIVVNELGEVGIDGALLGGDAARQIELPGGCVCCVLGDDLDRTLLELIDSVPDLDAILLETTGVAEPLPIAWAVSRDPVASRIRLAAVVTLVDATHFHASRSMSGAVDAQVAYADALLVTKSALVGGEATRAVVSEIRTLAPRALIRDGSTDEHAQWLEDVLVDPALESLQPSAPHADDHDHDHGIASAWVPVGGIVDLEELEDQLADLPGHFVRIKGIVFARDGRGGDPEPRWTAVHRVGLRVSSEPVPPPPFAEGRLVGLGPGVKAEDLADCVERSRDVSSA